MHPRRSSHSDRPNPDGGDSALSDDQRDRVLRTVDEDLEALALAAADLGGDALEYLTDLVEADEPDPAELVEAEEALESIRRLKVEVQGLRGTAAQLTTS